MKYPLLAIPFSTLILLTGCGGSSTGGDDSVVKPVPTVTVTAPTDAATTIAFNVAWSSTDATSCSSAFSTSTAVNGSASITVTEASTVTYSVTCTGAGGSATGSAHVVVSAAANPQGLWQGNASGNGGTRAFAGVVTDKNQYWLVYNGVDGSATNPAGFFVGTGVAANTSATAGTFNANGLIEFNFEGNGSAVGNLASTFTGKSAFNGTATSALSHLTGTQVYTIDGVTDSAADSGLGATLTNTPTPVTFNDGGSAWGIVPNANDPLATPSLTGTFHFTPYKIDLSIPLDPSNPSLVHINYPNRVLTIDHGTGYAVTFDNLTDPTHPTLTVTGVRFSDSVTTPDCTDNGGGAFCAFIPSTVAHGDIKITFSDATLTTYTGIAHAFQEVNVPGTIDPNPAWNCIHDSYAPTPADPSEVNACANAAFTFHGSVPASASATITQTFTSTYNTAYETAPAASAIIGSYSGNAGVDTGLEAGSSISVSGSGAITGNTGVTNCTITGTVAPHATKGNVYDVLGLTFTDNGGSTCTLVGETFTGAATFDAATQKITITAVNVAVDKGFLFVGTPQAM